jgi:hypothetical protein
MPRPAAPSDVPDTRHSPSGARYRNSVAPVVFIILTQFARDRVSVPNSPLVIDRIGRLAPFQITVRIGAYSAASS